MNITIPRCTPCTPPPPSPSVDDVVILPAGRGLAEALGILRATVHAFADDPRVAETCRALTALFAASHAGER